MKFIVFLGAFLWHLMPVSAQVKGMVKDNQGEPVVAANVFWINTTNGTVTDENGAFTIEQPVGAKKLVVRMIRLWLKMIIRSWLSYYKVV